MNHTESAETKPEYLRSIEKDKIKVLDVRPILTGGQDPFLQIMASIISLEKGAVLLILNSFEPVPLYKVLGKKGFEHHTELHGDEYHIYFWQDASISASPEILAQEKGDNAATVVIELDVRELEPPKPMIKILEKLTQLPECAVLLVHHHREPVMLYPKLEEHGFEATANKIEENYFKILISRKNGKKA